LFLRDNKLALQLQLMVLDQLWHLVRLSSQLSSQSSNLSTAFYAESSVCIKKSTSSVVKKKAEYIDFCDSAKVKSECLKYTKTATEVPIDQQTQISFLLRKFNRGAITSAFSMLIGKVAGAAPMAFFHCHQRKKIWFNNSYAWSMILSLWWFILKRSVTGMWKKFILWIFYILLTAIF